MTTSGTPPEFDLDFYRDHYPDLQALGNDELLFHFRAYGADEGRIAVPHACRADFLKLVEAEVSVLEIGPFCQPAATGSHVKYFDVLDTKGLIRRALDIGYGITSVPHIDYVSGTGDLSIVDRRFAAVLSSHCVEHQPDLVRHLNQVAEILEPGGKYYLIVPDRRYCFDAMIADSTIAEVLDANRELRDRHRLASVIEHRALTTHNDAARHWRGDHVEPSYFDSIAQRARGALSEFENSAGGYIDVHAWQFTPTMFKRIINDLRSMGLISLTAACVNPTPRDVFEFTVILVRDT